MGEFFKKASGRLTPWDKSVHVVLAQAPIVMERNEQGARCAWSLEGEDLMQSRGYQKVQQLIASQIAAMNGQANKLFLAGKGAGGHLAMLAAMYSNEALGGVFCLDAPAPEQVTSLLQSNEAAAIWPLYEAKKNMFVCITQWQMTLTEE